MGRGKSERIVSAAMANIAATLSRLSMDACLYLNQNFAFISFPDELTTGSSIMPHKKNLTATSLSVSVQLIERRIYLIRGQKVMLDFDLAEMYGVTTSRLNEQVTRNKKRFPEDFMFRLTTKEVDSLRSHFATLKA